MNPLTAHRLLGRCLVAPTPELAARLRDETFPWDGLIAAANGAYLTPALHAALRDSGLLPALPGEVSHYLAMIAERNEARNVRLRAQLAELVGALNRCGIVPTLLKGAAGIFIDSPYAASRMVTDLDLLVGADEVSDAVAILAALGYRNLQGHVPGRHAVGDFIRDIDVGAVDLHIQLMNEPHLLPVAEVGARTVECTVDGIRARILSPTDRVLHLLLHDLVQDHGIHDGRLNVRHLHEIAALAGTDAPPHWDRIVGHLARHRLGHLAEVTMIAARVFFGTSVPATIRPTLGARLLVWRSLMRMRHPRLARPSEIFGNVHRSLAWYRHAASGRRLPRLRRAADYLRAHRTRTAGRVLHVLFARRT
jgi:hypothetical protein